MVCFGTGTVPALFLIGSRRDGRCVVVEKTPEAMAVREPGGENWIVARDIEKPFERTYDGMNFRFLGLKDLAGTIEERKMKLAG